MIKIFGCVVFLLMISCNDRSSSSSKQTRSVKDTVAAPVPQPRNIDGCYQLVIAKDTASMKLVSSGDAVSGHLTYHRFEKDSNDGEFSGNIYPNGQIIVWYKFQAEGMISIRQSVFKIVDKGLAEGFGEVVMQHDTVVFKFPRALSFEDKHLFTKINCP